MNWFAIHFIMQKHHKCEMKYKVSTIIRSRELLKICTLTCIFWGGRWFFNISMLPLMSGQQSRRQRCSWTYFYHLQNCLRNEFKSLMFHFKTETQQVSKLSLTEKCTRWRCFKFQGLQMLLSFLISVNWMHGSLNQFTISINYDALQQKVP